MRTLYNAALFPVRAASYVFGAWPRGSPEAELERDQRLARRLPVVLPGGLWIHGASVGEARLVAALAGELRKRRPAQTILVSAVTATGRAQLPKPPAIDAAFFLPLDFAAVQRQAFDLLVPSMIVLVETELWPNLLAEAAARSIPVVAVNARLAPERLSRYRFLSGLYGPLLRGLAAIGVSGHDEVARFVSLGVAPEAVQVLGNLKFDLPAPADDGAGVRAGFGIDPQRPVVAAGSTGDGEDALVLDAFAAARRDVRDLLLILAPRHPARFDAAAGEAIRRGLNVVRVSTGETARNADVLLVDGLGRLASLYAMAGSAFVGGSLVPVGGHNLLEPLAAGAPVLFGPHTGHVAEIADELIRCHAGERVNDAAALGRAFAHLATHPEERARRAAAGRDVLAAHRGALSRAAGLVLSISDRSRQGGPS
jgi:3-deoxy-D-manno-octulosonic-acid transferase